VLGSVRVRVLCCPWSFVSAERSGTDHDRICGGPQKRDDEPIRWMAAAYQGRGSRHTGDRDDPVERSNEIAVHNPRCKTESSVRMLEGFGEIEACQTRCLEKRLELW